MLSLKQTFLVAVTAATLLSSASHAFDPSSPHSLSVGIEGFKYKYTEPRLMQDKGPMFGINGEYFYNFKNNFYLGVDARIAFGKANYKSNGTGSMKRVKQFLCGERFLGGYTIPGQTFTHSFYTGLGYRLKSDHSGGRVTTTGHHGYDRVSRYIYLPLGAKMKINLGEKLDLQTFAELDLLLVGKQKSYTYNNINHTQKRGYGFKTELLAGYKMNKSKLSVGPYFNYWHIKKSNVVANTIEPFNKTTETGLKAKWSF